MKVGSHKILTCDVLDGLASLAEGSVQTCITSPPYWALRDYGVAGQIGLEPTPAEYLERMVAVFREVRRVLRDDGTCWVNMGDGYASGDRASYGFTDPNWKQATCANIKETPRRSTPPGLKPKDLIGMPWRLAFALQADGWWLRSDIIWHKPNPMPESVTDRPTKAHEYVFLLSKRERYYWDQEAVKESNTTEPHSRGGAHEALGGPMDRNGHSQYDAAQQDRVWGGSGRNLRTVWTIPTQPFPDAHFATFPGKLVEPCVKAGTSERGCCPKCGRGWERDVERTAMVLDRSERAHERGRTRSSGTMVEPPSSRTLGWSPACACPPHEPVHCTVLDPFCGSGTTGTVACPLGRDFIGIELNPAYAKMAEERIGRALRPGTYRSDDGESDLFSATGAQ